jgi:hypothetical protein
MVFQRLISVEHQGMVRLLGSVGERRRVLVLPGAVRLCAALFERQASDPSKVGT